MQGGYFRIASGHFSRNHVPLNPSLASPYVHEGAGGDFCYIVHLVAVYHLGSRIEGLRGYDRGHHRHAVPLFSKCLSVSSANARTFSNRSTLNGCVLFSELPPHDAITPHDFLQLGGVGESCHNTIVLTIVLTDVIQEVQERG